MDLSLVGIVPELSEDETMYAFASGITTAMLSGIGISVGIMVFMTVAALFHRAAMGGKQDQTTANENRGLQVLSENVRHFFVGGFHREAKPHPTPTTGKTWHL